LTTWHCILSAELTKTPTRLVNLIEIWEGGWGVHGREGLKEDK